MKRRTTVAGLCFAALLAAAAGCGSSGDSGSSGGGGGTPAKTDQSKHRGGTLTMLWNGAGTSIDTALDYDHNWQVLTMTSDGLLNYPRAAGERYMKANSAFSGVSLALGTEPFVAGPLP